MSARQPQQIVRVAWKMFLQDKHLMILPLLNVVVGLAGFVVVVGSHLLVTSTILDAQSADGLRYLTQGLFIFAEIFTATFIGMFFEVALTAAAFERLSGRTPSIEGALLAASERKAVIVKWSLLAAALGTFIRLVTERFRLTGLIFRFFAQLAFAIATYFVAPLLLVNSKGPVVTLKDSVKLMREKFGLVARVNIRYGFIATFAGMLTFIPLVGGIAMVAQTGFTSATSIPGYAVLILGVVALLTYIASGRVVSSYIKAMLFVSASGHAIPGVDRAMIDEVVVYKK